MDGGVDGWLENEFLKKTPSPKFGLESQLGTSDLEFVKTNSEHLKIDNKKAHSKNKQDGLTDRWTESTY